MTTMTTATTAVSHVDPRDFTTMSQAALDDLFRRGVPAPIPSGDTSGTAILLPGTVVAPVARLLIRSLVWKGKVFDPATHALRNKLSPAAVRGIRADVYAGESWLDGEPVIVIDYSKTSFVAQKIRDEIRLVSPGVYLGKVWWGKHRVCDFALQV